MKIQCFICGSDISGEGRCATCGIVDPRKALIGSRTISADKRVESVQGRVINSTLKVLPSGKRLLEIQCVVMKHGVNKNGVNFPHQVLRKALPLGADKFGYFGHLDDETWLKHKGMVVMDRVCCAWRGEPHWDESIGGAVQTGVVWKDEAIDMIQALEAAELLHMIGPSTDLITDGDSRVEDGKLKKNVSVIEGWTTTDIVGYPAAGGEITRVLNALSQKGPKHERLVAAMHWQQGATTMAELAKNTGATEEAARRAAVMARKEDYDVIEGLVRDYDLGDREASAVRAKRREMTERPTVKQLEDIVVSVRDANATHPKPPVRQTGVDAEVTYDFRTYAEKALLKMFDRTYSEDREVSAWTGMKQFVEAWYANYGHNERVENGTVLDVMRGVNIVSIPYNEFGNRLAYTGAVDQKKREINARMAAKSILLEHANFWKDKRAASALMDSDITAVTQSVMNKSALKFYVLAQNGSDPSFASPDLLISRKISTTRFGDTHYFVRLQELDLASTVSQGAAYPVIVNPASISETAFVSRKGYIIQVTEQALANDDLGLVKLLPESLGRGLGNTKYHDLFDILLNNTALVSDGQALGSTAHANNIATALSYPNLKTMMRYMLRKKAYGQGTAAHKQTLATRLRQIICSATLYPDILELITLETNPNVTERSASALVNPKTPPITVHPVPYWDETNTALYWGTDDPLKGAAELIIELQYQGREDPELFSQEAPEVGSMFTNDLWTIKGRDTYGFGIAGAEGFVRGQG